MSNVPRERVVCRSCQGHGRFGPVKAVNTPWFRDCIPFHVPSHYTLEIVCSECEGRGTVRSDGF